MKEVQKAQNYSDEVLPEDMSVSPTEDEKSTPVELRYIWETIDQKLENIKDNNYENISLQRIKARKGVDMSRAERNIYINSVLSFIRYTVLLLINITKRMIQLYLIYGDENKQEPNTDDKICEAVWNLERTSHPSGKQHTET